MRYKAVALALACFLLTSCALFNPYVSTASIEQCKKSNSVYDLSCALRAKFENNAAGLAYWQSGSTVLLAGMLGLGGYKGITGAGSHQIAALAAGGGVIYGTSTALYRTSKEQVYISGVAALLCLDNHYRLFDSTAGADLFRKLLELDSTAETEFRTAFIEAYSIAVEREASYKTKVLTVGTQVNALIAGQQPTAGVSYAHVSSAISAAFVSSPDTQKPGEPEKNVWARAFSLLSPLGDQKRFKEREERARQIKQLRADLANWINSMVKLNTWLDTTASDQCSVLGEDSLSITGVTQGKPEALEAGLKNTYPILNTTGRLAAFVKAPKATEQGAVTAKIITENGLFFVEVEGVSVTTAPANVYVSDYGKGRATKGFQVTVNKP